MSSPDSSHKQELIAFALIQEDYSATGDIAHGLMPLFTPILASEANRVFDPEWFADKVEERYDIPMSQLVAEGLAPKMQEAGLLYQTNPGDSVYRIKPLNADEKPAESEELNDLITGFIDFATDALKHFELQISATDLELGFLHRLRTIQFLTFLERPEKNYYHGTTITLDNRDDDDGDLDSEHIVDILSAEYVLQILERGGNATDLIQRLVSGALIADLVLTLQTPTPTSSLQGATVLLDGPLILDYFDLSTPEYKDFANDLFKMLGKAGVKIATYAHMVREMKNAVQTPLDRMRRGEELSGILGNRLRQDPDHASYAWEFVENIENLLEKHGIRILDAEDYNIESLQQYCSSELEDSFYNGVGSAHRKVDQRRRDAASLAAVLRLRGARRHPRNISDAGWVLVTRNDAVAYDSRKILHRKDKRTRSDFPPAVTDRELAGLLWFAVGGALGALSRKKLIANCTQVVMARGDIVSKVRQYLKDLDPEKEELFVALMRNQRAQRALVHSTLASPTLINRRNAEELLERAKEATALEVKREAEQRERQLQESFQERLENQAQEHQNQIQEKEEELLRLKGDFRHSKQDAAAQASFLEDQIAEHKSQLEKLDQQFRSDYQNRISKVKKAIRTTQEAIKYLMIGFYSTLIVAIHLILPTPSNYSSILATVAAILAFWKFPDHMYGYLANRAIARLKRRKCKDLNVNPGDL